MTAQALSSEYSVVFSEMAPSEKKSGTGQPARASLGAAARPPPRVAWGESEVRGRGDHDWDLEYATIGERARRTAQLSFLDLHEKGHVYTSDAPTMWDVDFRTAVAQAETEDREQSGAYYHIEFGVAGQDRTFVIATTRPELLAVSDIDDDGELEYWATRLFIYDTGITLWRRTADGRVELMTVCSGCSD